MTKATARKKRYRVVQWGTGMVGTHALRAIAERGDLELAGVFVYNQKKVGKDACEIFRGATSTGVRCTSSREDILKIDADCVNYNGLSSTLQNPYAAVDDLCTLLEAGFHVTSSAPEMLVYPPYNPPEILARIDRACRKGGTSLFISGINPGYMFEVLPVTLSRICRRIDHLYCAEIASMLHMNSPAHFKTIGYGLPPGTPAPFQEVIALNVENNPYSCVFHVLADALHIDFERTEFRIDDAVSDKPIKAAAGLIEPGTISVRKFSFIGWSKGREVVELDFVWRCDQDARPDWPNGDKYIIRIDGDPSMQTEITAQTQFDSKRPISLYVAMSCVNAIPTICDSKEPGLKYVLDLPMWGARTVVSDL
jgi:4-hydroxy-tetrahydrodipicolinate reductase